MVNPKILAVVEDLFFLVKISEAAKQAGLPVEFVKTEIDALHKAGEHPAAIVIDLNFSGIDPVGLIRKLKEAPETTGIGLIGYVSHVQADLKREAEEAGCDVVLARSAFSRNLPEILKRYSEGGV